MKWVSELYYQGHLIIVMELKIEKDEKEAGEFQWVTNLKITGKTVWEFAKIGRKRWQIENEGFNIQKNYRYDITHANSLNYNAMKNHYLLTQIADILLQLYENGVKGLREKKNPKKYIFRFVSKLWPAINNGRYIIYSETHINKHFVIVIV